jgi:SPP1 family predicted phage head-tail adaptor
MGEIGNMERKIEILEPTTTKSSMGAPQKTYTHLCYLWAERKTPSPVPEQYVGNRPIVPSRYVWKVHYTSDLDETMRIVDDGTEYNILSLDPSGRMFIEITGEKITE